MISSDFRAEARRKLVGKWGTAACIMLAYGVISFLISFIEGLLPDSLSALGSILNIAIEVPLSFGLIFSFLKLFNDEDVKAFDFVKLAIDNFGRAWGVSLYTFLKMIVPLLLILLGYFLLVGVGIYFYSTALYGGSSTVSVLLALISFVLIVAAGIWAFTKSFYYKLAHFVAMENPTMNTSDAVSESEKLMTGKRFSFFCLDFSFIGWAILATLTFGIGFLWLIPYVECAHIVFYKYLSKKDTNVEVEATTAENTTENI